MLAFGLGTLPMLLSMGMAGRAAAQLDPAPRRCASPAALVVLGFGVLGLAARRRRHQPRLARRAVPGARERCRERAAGAERVLPLRPAGAGRQPLAAAHRRRRARRCAAPAARRWRRRIVASGFADYYGSRTAFAAPAELAALAPPELALYDAGGDAGEAAVFGRRHPLRRLRVADRAAPAQPARACCAADMNVATGRLQVQLVARRSAGPARSCARCARSATRPIRSIRRATASSSNASARSCSASCSSPACR